MREEPLPPAAAYEVMAELLPESYFVTPPPVSGVRLTVIAGDGVATTWDVDPETAETVVDALHRRCCRVTRKPYTGRVER